MAELKICTHCKETKPATTEYFGIKKSGNHGLNAQCKVCVGIYKSELYTQTHTRRVLPKDGMQICSLCKTEKPATSEYFNTNKTLPLGLTCQCKACKVAKRLLKIDVKRESDKIRYLSNPAIVKARVKKYAKEHPEWNRERGRICARKFRELHPDILLERNRNHRENNRDMYAAYSELRRSKKRMLLSTLTPQEWKVIKNKFYNVCAYCGSKCNLVQDHFIPVKFGGEYTHNNIIPSCVSCNSSKATRSFFVWYPSYKHYNIKREKLILKFLNYIGDVQQISIFM